VAIILVASAGKFAAAMIAAPIARMQWRDASAFGALMNARGLMELIVLNIGLDVGVIMSRLSPCW
jgi:Kef-type K+ transport system membrane component KefB